MGAIRVGIVNVTGYAGADLARLLANHPKARVVAVTGRSAVGQPLGRVFPHLDGLGLTVEGDVHDVDVVFSALPHHASAEVIPQLLERCGKVIDISADYRLQDVAEYEQWYGPHPSPHLLPEAVYGLPEVHKDEVQKARLVANPGCYPTAAILALAPIVDRIESDVIVDAKSGISGAGRAMELSVNHYCEVNESCQAYGLDGHRHEPEIRQELQLLRDRSIGAGNRAQVRVTFVPHLVPMTRGVLATCYGRLTLPLSQEEVLALYREYYASAPFVKVVDSSPQTKHTLGSNWCLVHPKVQERTGLLVAIGCIDNLVKGAAGQGIQNMNLMMGLPEAMGLEALPLYP